MKNLQAFGDDNIKMQVQEKDILSKKTKRNGTPGPAGLPTLPTGNCLSLVQVRVCNSGDFVPSAVTVLSPAAYVVMCRGCCGLHDSSYKTGQAGLNSLYDVPGGVVALLSLCYGSISVLAVVGNSLVMWIVATSRRMQNVTNCFIANLALADIVIGLFAIPFQFQAALLQRWNLPHFMCAFCPFVQVLSVNVSIFTLTAIAIDRHRAILNPLR
ncbi:neuropeptide Y receptor type 1-like [Schistocerca piceifrons]|uniref:neuropeptide Y receptor type 1-like n=1 Tax=Schistocerca piceifrons TaxID=274613 RepID=UPI001F5E3A09|nr:neuropeptide Y receptor type 1-like [Schistocerca piceifrons]